VAGAPGFPAKKIGLFQAFEKALLSGKPEMQVRQSGKTVKQTVFCPALRNRPKHLHSIEDSARRPEACLASASMSEAEMISASRNNLSENALAD
jgi:hypothetical protein